MIASHWLQREGVDEKMLQAKSMTGTLHGHNNYISFELYRIPSSVPVGKNITLPTKDHKNLKFHQEVSTHDNDIHISLQADTIPETFTYPQMD